MIAPKIVDPVRKWRRRLLVTIIAAFLVVIGLFCAASWMSQQKQGARVALQEYGEALVAKDYARAYSLRDSELQRRLAESEFERSHELAESRYGRLKEVKIDPGGKVGAQNGMTVMMNCRMVYESAEDRFVVTMRKEGDSWLISDYRLEER